jgi:hypothetical protein
MNKKVIIIIPIYKTDLSDTEKISLQQLSNVLGHYTIAFVAPNSLKFDYTNICYDTSLWMVERFPDDYFESTESYSKMMLSEEFYYRFSAYEYMFIYQLDGFVFSDKLLYFCSLGYDYIGAPVSRKVEEWKRIGASIGNGGVSLRKIDSVLAVLKIKKTLHFTPKIKEDIEKYEDLFFGFCGVNDNIKFSVPTVDLAMSFSIENEIRGFYKNGMKTIPFCCHAWNKKHFNEWHPYIERFGYMLSDLYKGRRAYNRKDVIGKYILKRFSNYNNDEYIHILEDIFSEYGSICIWGLGEVGKLCFSAICSLGLKIEFIVDNNIKGNFKDILIVNSDQSKLLRNFQGVCLISSIEYENEIKKQCNIIGIKNVLTYSEFQDMLIKKYLISFKKCGEL